MQVVAPTLVFMVGQLAGVTTNEAGVCWHAPEWHKPLFPHGGAGTHIDSAVPSGTAPQCPALLQAWQAPVQAESQQRPSAQKPVLQSVLTVQVCPIPDLSPHLLVTVLHATPVVQSALVVQLVLHWVALRQRYCPQEVTVAAGQTPLPSHCAAEVSIPPVQDWARQPVLLG